jgi:hypothetical protein
MEKVLTDFKNRLRRSFSKPARITLDLRGNKAEARLSLK